MRGVLPGWLFRVTETHGAFGVSPEMRWQGESRNCRGMSVSGENRYGTRRSPIARRLPMARLRKGYLNSSPRKVPVALAKVSTSIPSRCAIEV